MLKQHNTTIPMNMEKNKCFILDTLKDLLIAYDGVFHWLVEHYICLAVLQVDSYHLLVLHIN